MVNLERLVILVRLENLEHPVNQEKKVRKITLEKKEC
jgi:hypothetical protein